MIRVKGKKGQASHLVNEEAITNLRLDPSGEVSVNFAGGGGLQLDQEQAAEFLSALGLDEHGARRQQEGQQQGGQASTAGAQ